jgi:HrpA-like RNA helicase
LASPKQGAVAVTQPRRVAATSLAKRVAEEAGTTLGYKVSFDLRYSSDNILLGLTHLQFRLVIAYVLMIPHHNTP